MKLTDKQIAQLADKLIDTCNNIYLVGKQLFPKGKITDEDWDRLAKIGGIFKCVECNRWLSVSLKEPGLEDTCTDCAEDQPCT